MKQLIKWIVDFIISFLKDLVMKNHIEKLEKEVEDANKDVERANESYHEFMSLYSDYQSDLKRRGMSTLQSNSGEVRKDSKGPEEGDRQSKDSN
jgi:heme oxygenase